MKDLDGRATVLIVFVTFLSGCMDRVPTSPQLEQTVFAALGGLAVGESYTFRGGEAGEFVFGGGLTGEYLVVPFHASSTSDARVQLHLAGTGIVAPPVTATAVAGDGLDPHHGPAEWQLHERQHAMRMQQMREHLEGLRRSNSLGLLTLPPARGELGGTNAHVGQVVQLNANALGPACQARDMRPGRVEYISRHAIIVADTTNPPGGFTADDYRFFGEEFDRLVHPAITRHFGEPTDIDGNSRSIVFFTRAVNELSTPALDGVVLGFFWVRDLVPRVAGCPASNESEIFFMLVPDPDARASHLSHSRESVRRSTIATIGHEYQHLINAGGRLQACGLDCFEEAWMDEGLSHVAEEVLFYAASGRSPGSNVSRENVTDAEREVLNEHMTSNLIRYGIYLGRVNTTSPTSNDGFSLEMRGAIWSFLRYAADRTGIPDDQFFRRLAQTTRTGFANLDAALESNALDWLREWGVSLYADDLVPDAPEEFQQPSWHFRSWLTPVFSNRFPLRVEPLRPGQGVDLTIKSGSSAFVRVRSSPGEVVRVTATSAGAPPPHEVRITILRTE